MSNLFETVWTYGISIKMIELKTIIFRQFSFIASFSAKVVTLGLFYSTQW